MAESMSWVLVILLTYNIALRFGTISDMVALTNLLTLIVFVVWAFLYLKKHKLYIKIEFLDK
jgi:hypothetical protein